jgi:hypothetical protein
LGCVPFGKGKNNRHSQGFIGIARFWKKRVMIVEFCLILLYNDHTEIMITVQEKLKNLSFFGTKQGVKAETFMTTLFCRKSRRN